MITYDMDAKEIEVELERGEYEGQKWKGTFDICEHPVCNCSGVFLKISGESAAEQADLPPVHFLGIDVFEKEAVEPKEKDEFYNADFAKTFADDLTDENLLKLRELFTIFKADIVENAPLENVDVKFPWKKIEKQGNMIGFREIFPWGEMLFVEVDNNRFLLEDQYCLASNCGCTDAVLAFMPRDDVQKYKSTDVPYILFNYNKNSWKIEYPGSGAMPSPNALINEVKKQKLAKKLKKRHERLRYFYSLFLFRKASKKRTKMKSGGKSKKKIAPAPDPGIDPNRKIGRNAPCPCGSGRKYKKCCLKK